LAWSQRFADSVRLLGLIIIGKRFDGRFGTSFFWRQ